MPRNLPDRAWLYDLVQLWQYAVHSAVHLDQKIFQDKQAFRLQQDKRSCHNKLTFASIRGSTPTLESIESRISQQAILVPLPRRLSPKAPERFEAFVDDPSEFQIGQPVSLKSDCWVVARDPGVLYYCLVFLSPG